LGNSLIFYINLFINICLFSVKSVYFIRKISFLFF